MGLTYNQDDIKEQSKVYTEFKKSVENRVQELSDVSDSDRDKLNNWEWDQLDNSEEWEAVWATAQDIYPDIIEYESPDDLAKLAEAAYYSVEEQLDDADWTRVQDRIVDFTFCRHQDVQDAHDITAYLPAWYASDATQEIVIHAVTLELLGRSGESHRY
jgi:hypothetical protein